jgi:hypothetical protein
MDEPDGVDSDNESAWDEVLPDYSLLDQEPSTKKPIEITLEPAHVDPAKKKRAEKYFSIGPFIPTSGLIAY